MTNRNEFPGYVVTPGCKKAKVKIRLEFNPTIAIGPKDSRLENFNLRLFWLPPKFTQKDAEIGVTLSAEQWLDLIDSMKSEFVKAEARRKKFDKLFPDDK
mgnify:CR=1 FL=1